MINVDLVMVELQRIIAIKKGVKQTHKQTNKHTNEQKYKHTDEVT